MCNPMRRALRLLAGLRVVVGLGVSTGLDTATSNVSPPVPIRWSAFILRFIERERKRPRQFPQRQSQTANSARLVRMESGSLAYQAQRRS
jgi:hypothetical protein